jgi:hypothetical protein
MNRIISYETIIGLLPNPPSLDPCPNFFNLCALQTHFAWALKKVPCPQSNVNGWVGTVLTPAMYALIDTTAFHWKIKPKTPVLDFPARLALKADGTQGASLPYSRVEILTITAEHTLKKNYYGTGISTYATPVLASLAPTMPALTRQRLLLPHPPSVGICQ